MHILKLEWLLQEALSVTVNNHKILKKKYYGSPRHIADPDQTASKKQSGYGLQNFPLEMNMSKSKDGALENGRVATHSGKQGKWWKKKSLQGKIGNLKFC